MDDNGAADRLFASVTMMSARRFQILLAGQTGGSDMTRLRAAWRSAGVDLLGPVPADDIEPAACWRLDGVLILLETHAVGTQRLADQLDSLDIPFLFLMPGGSSEHSDGIFRLSDDVAEIKDLIAQLSHQDRRYARH